MKDILEKRLQELLCGGAGVADGCADVHRSGLGGLCESHPGSILIALAARDDRAAAQRESGSLRWFVI